MGITIDDGIMPKVERCYWRCCRSPNVVVECDVHKSGTWNEINIKKVLLKQGEMIAVRRRPAAGSVVGLRIAFLVLYLCVRATMPKAAV